MSLVPDRTASLDTFIDRTQTGLSDAQINAIEAALGDRYLVDRHDACETGMALMITASEAGDPESVLYVDAEPVGFCLSFLVGEVLQHRGNYTSVDGLVRAIRALD